MIFLYNFISYWWFVSCCPSFAYVLFSLINIMRYEMSIASIGCVFSKRNKRPVEVGGIAVMLQLVNWTDAQAAMNTARSSSL